VNWDTRPWGQRLGDATSQWLNVALFAGVPDESLSGRSWRRTALAPVPHKGWQVVAWLAERQTFGKV
jgi:hypothetical protein